MQHITSVKELTEILDGVEQQNLSKVMKSIKIRSNEFDPFATWKEQCYTRNCLARTNKYELILLCWDINAKAPIHGHGGENCWVYQIKGTVEEIRFTEESGNLTETNRIVLTPGKLTYMNDQMGYHAISNISNQKSMTLHIYARPIDSCKVFNEHKDCFEVKEMTYHTFKGNEVLGSVV
jgi:cysteine dioxygenase